MMALAHQWILLWGLKTCLPGQKCLMEWGVHSAPIKLSLVQGWG